MNEYKVSMSNSEDFKPISELNHEELQRLLAETNASLDACSVTVVFVRGSKWGKSIQNTNHLTEEQKEILGENYNPYYNSNITVKTNDDEVHYLFEMIGRSEHLDVVKAIKEYCENNIDEKHEISTDKKTKKKQAEMER